MLAEKQLFLLKHVEFGEQQESAGMADSDETKRVRDIQKKLIGLVDYVQHMVRLADKPIFAINEYKHIFYPEQKLKNRVGIHHDLSDEDGSIWLKIQRLARIDPG